PEERGPGADQAPDLPGDPRLLPGACPAPARRARLRRSPLGGHALAGPPAAPDGERHGGADPAPLRLSSRARAQVLAARSYRRREGSGTVPRDSPARIDPVPEPPPGGFPAHDRRAP